MLKFLLYIYHGRLALMGIYPSLTARHLHLLYFLLVLYLLFEVANKFLSLSLGINLRYSATCSTS